MKIKWLQKIIVSIIVSCVFLGNVTIVESVSENNDDEKETSNIVNNNLSFDKTPSDILKEQTDTQSSDGDETAIDADVAVAEEIKEHKVSFVVSGDASFLDGGQLQELFVGDNQKIDRHLIPELTYNEKVKIFNGWSINGKDFTNDQLEQLSITEPITAIAIVKDIPEIDKLLGMSQPDVMPRTPFAASFAAANSLSTIAGIIPLADQAKVVLIPDPTSTAAYKAYTLNEAGVKSALSDLYASGAGRDFILYIGGTITLSAATTAKSITTPVTPSNATFYSLAGKVGTLGITGIATDPITNNTTATVGQNTLNFPTNVYFNTNILIRNINYTGSNLYMGGYSLSLDGGSFAPASAWNIYGGTDTGNITGSPTIKVNSTGSGIWNIYGGNSDGGTLTGDVSIVVNNTSGAVNTLTSGAKVGTIVGNLSLTINNAGGAISTIYGGGVGTSTTPANVTGNVNNVINAPNGTLLRLVTFMGGTLFGNISGTITNTISGYGGWTSVSGEFFGGSGTGNVGTTLGITAITNNIDSSLFATGGAYFVGANRIKGTMTGAISNTLKAGPTWGQGSFYTISGGGGVDALTGIGGATNDAATPAQRAAVAKANAQYVILGNITNNLISGCLSYGAGYYTRGAGYAGYVEGNISTTVGTLNPDSTVGGPGQAFAGFDQATTTTNTAYSNANNGRALTNGWDIVGGGGTPGGLWDIYIYGNTNLVFNNLVARWTYGGSFSGVIEGNTNFTVNGGILDTVEGAGYTARRIYGSTQVTMNQGQVDWFLSGGGWGDELITGNVGVTVNNGTINASLGASYGIGNHTINGNSNNTIYGGDFLGSPRTGPSALGGGITNSGILLGNANLTIDLRNSTVPFSLPAGTNISGGTPVGSTTSILGTNALNTITLNIYTGSGSNSLSGANIYGDGTATQTNTRSGSIFINIDAPGSNIGNLYATNISNISGGILKNVDVKVQRAQAITSISGGSASDDFTNTVVSAGTKHVNLTFGATITGSNYQTTPLSATVTNFTNLTLNNGIKLIAPGTGKIVNGSGATAANHGTSYGNFGNININEGSVLGTTTGYISGGTLTVKDKSKIQSAPGTGVINISDFTIPNQATDQLTWLKTTTGDTGVSSTGTWFGNQTAFQVLTINPTKANATKVIPYVFRGVEIATGKGFIGDNDTTKTTNGYGIMIPGSIIDYQVTNPTIGIAVGSGAITHDVTQIKANNLPLTIQGWGTEVANTPVQSGLLMIPSSSGISPKLTFTPETPTTGSWVYSGTIATSQVGGTTQTIAESSNSNPASWTTANGQYNYTVKVSFTNQAQLTASHVIVSESEAALITNSSQISAYNQASGRPFLTNNVDAAMISTIQQPLGSGITHQVYPIVYTTGTGGGNTQSQTVNLIVVKDGSNITTNRLLAVYAKSANLTVTQANNLVDLQQLETEYTMPVAISAGGAIMTPTASPSTAFNTIKNATTTIDVPITYSYTNSDGTASIGINVHVSAGSISFTSAPTTVDFANQFIANRDQQFWATYSSGLTVTDSRSTFSNWTMQVNLSTPLANGPSPLTGTINFMDDGTPTPIGEANVLVHSQTTAGGEVHTISDNWGQAYNKGFMLDVPVIGQRLGTYQGTLTWTLVVSP